MPSKRADTSVEDYLPLKPAVLHIGLVLASGPCHGYAIMQQVGELSRRRIEIGPGALYRALQRMVLDEFLREVTPAVVDDSEQDERRRYYELSSLGKRVLAAECKRLTELVEHAERHHIFTRPVRRKSGA